MPKKEHEDDYEELDLDLEEEEEDKDELDRGDTLDDDDSEDEDTEQDEEENEDEDDEDSLEENDEDDEEDSESSDDDEEHRIPKHRLDEVIAQREDARELARKQQDQIDQLLQLVKGKETKDEPKKEPEFTYDFDEAEAKYTEAIIEGESATAAGIRKEIRAAERKLAQIEAQNLSSVAVKEARSEAQRIRDDALFEKAITINEEKYPFLDQGNDDYNDKAVSKINNLYDKFLKAGSTKAEALQEAVDLIAPSYVKEEPVQEGLGKAKPKRSPKDARKRNARANNSQPPKMRGKTSKDKSIDEYDITKMSDAQYAKLPADIKRKLRGDS